MSQTYTSASTSMNARKLPKVYSKLPDLQRHSLLFDYGAGKFTDHIREAFPDVVYLPYDPYNQPDDVNAVSLTYLANAMHVRCPVTVVCSNVLNVIDDDAEIGKIAARIVVAVVRTGGTGYVTVYEGDRSGIGRQTGKDQYQRNQRLETYLDLFRFPDTFTWYGKTYRGTASIDRGMIVVRCEEVKA